MQERFAHDGLCHVLWVEVLSLRHLNVKNKFINSLKIDQNILHDPYVYFFLRNFANFLLENCQKPFNKNRYHK